MATTNSNTNPIFPFHIALDTNVYVMLAALTNKKLQKERESMIKDGTLKYVKQLASLIKQGKIAPYITPSIHFELCKFEYKHNRDIMTYILPYNLNFAKPKDMRKYNKDVYNLAVCYSDPKDYDNNIPKEKIPYAFKRYKLTEDCKVLANDSLIMAEVTVYGLPIITFDKHFLKNNTPNKIKKANKKNGYLKCFYPHSVPDFINEIKNCDFNYGFKLLNQKEL